MLNRFYEEKEITLALDMDGVLTDPGNAVIEEMKRRPHLAHLVKTNSYQMLTHSDFERCFPSEYEAEIESIPREKGFFRNLQPLPGAIEAIEQLVYAGIRPWILTAPFKNNPTNGQIEKAEWLGEHIYSKVGHNGIRGVLFTNQKELLGLDFVVEDRPHKFYPLHLQGKLPWTLITLAQPWNENDPNPLRISWTRENPAKLRRPGRYFMKVFHELGIFGK